MKTWYLEPFDFYFYFTTQLSELSGEEVYYKFQADLAKSTESAALCHMDDKKRGAYIYIAPDKGASFIELVDIVAHEVYHAVGFLYEAIEDNTQIQATPEIPAYIQGWLTGEIIKELGYE